MAFPAEHREFFQKDNLAAISTLGEDGGPRVTMVWVALCAFDKEDVNHNVTVIGHVVAMTTEGGWEHVQKLARKYGRERYEGPSDRVIIRVAVDRSYLYRPHRAGASPPV